MLNTLITSKTRINLLLKFFLNPGTKAYLRELSAEFGESTNAVRVELNRLTDAKILKSSSLGRKIIYSNANKNHVDQILLRLDLTNMFDDIYDIKMANYIPKPEIKPYKEFINKFGIDPKKTIMFDDIAKNLVPAKNLGFTSVWIDIGEENISDDIKNSKNYLDFTTKDLTLFLDEVNRGLL